MNLIRHIGKKIAFFFVVLTLAMSLTGSALYAQLDAQGARGDSPTLSAEELQQLQELYNTQDAGSSLDGGYGTPIDYGSGYPGDASSGLGGLGMLGALSGGGMMPLLGLVAASLGDMMWIAVVLYLLALLSIVAVLYASMFRKFKRFSREQAMVFGWNMAKKYIWFFVLIIVIQLAIFMPLFILFVLGMGVPSIGFNAGSPGIFAPYTTPVLWALGVAIAFFIALFSLGISKITLALVDGGKPRVADLFTGIVVMPKFIASLIVYVLMILLPYILLGVVTSLLADKVSPLQLFIGGSVIAILLAIPVSNFVLRFYMFHIVVVDKKVWPLKALKLSSQYSKGTKTDFFLWLSLLFAIGWAAGGVPLALGVFLAYPLTSLAYTHTYRQLEKSSQA